MQVTEIEPRVLDKICFEPNTGCWLWAGALTSNGYSEIKRNKKNMRVYDLWLSPLPVGSPERDHVCHVRCCVNPDHLEYVTKRVNQYRGTDSRARERGGLCVRGLHPWVEGNIYTQPSNGKRRCMGCNRDDQAARRAAR